MRAIYKREFMAYMHSVIGQLFIAVTVFFFGLYATVYHMLSGYSNVSYTMSAIIFLFLITIPVLTMRIMADERKQKTDQLILTAPISVGKIVIGKYLAMVTVFILPVIFMCFLPLFLSKYGTISMVESYVAIAAFALYGMTCIAIGMFVSSLTESQVIAAVISFAILFITYMMAGIESLISATGNLFTKFLSIFDFSTRFSNLTGGVLDLTVIVYFISVTVMLLFLTVQSIQKRRYTVSIKNIAMGAYSSVTIVIVIAIVVILNFAVSKMPTKYTSFDITQNRIYSITDQTKELLHGLDTDITIYVISSEQNADKTVAQTLKAYQDESAHIHVEYVDPLVNPQFVRNYSQDNVYQNSLIVESEKRYQLIGYSDLYETEIDYSTYQSYTTGYDAEGQITSAISYCISDDMPKMYVIAGHNELGLDSGFSSAIEKMNVTYETISLMDVNEVPEDAEYVLIAAPENDFSADDADKIIAYMEKGGNVILTTQYMSNGYLNLQKILDYHGLGLQMGYTVDVNAGNYYQIPTYLLPNVEYCEETTGLTGSYSYVLAPLAQGIYVPEDTDEISYTKILTCSDNSWVKVNDGQTYDFEDGDYEGPVCIGVKSVKNLGDQESVLYVFTSAELFTDYADSAVSGNNKVLFTNIISSIADFENNISIPSKSYEANNLLVSAKDAYFFMVIVVVLIPLALIISGIVVWTRRRKK